MEAEQLTFDDLRARARRLCRASRCTSSATPSSTSYTQTRDDRRPDQDADHVSVRFEGQDGFRRRRRRRRQAPARRPAPRSRSPPCSATTRWKEFVLEDLQAGRRRTASRSSTRRARPPTRTPSSAGGYRLLKVDTLDNRSISDAHPGAARQPDRRDQVPTCVVFSDFRHGIFNRRDHPGADRRPFPTGVFRVADSQVASRWGNILDFQGFDLITPNEREARFALGDQDSVVRPLALEAVRAGRGARR